jgi:hypothetical protein
VKIIDTVYNASAKTSGTVQFNTNGTFSSSSLLTPQGDSPYNVPSASNSGTYSYSPGVFTIVPGLSGWFAYNAGSGSELTDDSSSAQVTTLTASNLDIHITLTIGVTSKAGFHAFFQVTDYSYTR